MQLLLIHIISILSGLSLVHYPSMEIIVQKAEIQSYLSLEFSPKSTLLHQELDFWETKLKKTPNQFPYKLKLAEIQNKLFKLNGEINFLNASTENLESANRQTNSLNAAILRRLGRNYISHHRFRDALDVLSQAEVIGENLIETQKMLFDISIELGNYEMAGCYLAEICKRADFDYFIRMAKWQDHLGELNHAIHFMELAVEQAEMNNQEELMLWAYTNLGDFYGHAGRIKDAYSMYNKALFIEPENVYALKQIAWITYSHEKNTQDAYQILQSIETRYVAPDLLLMQAEIKEFEGVFETSSKLKSEFLRLASDARYGRMYNSVIAELLVEKNQVEEAVALAKKEVEERSTPETYALLAWCYAHEDKIDIAYNLIKEKVTGNTSEPIPNYIAAKIYKQLGLKEDVLMIKKELEESSFELGPIMSKNIKGL